MTMNYIGHYSYTISIRTRMLHSIRVRMLYSRCERIFWLDPVYDMYMYFEFKITKALICVPSLEGLGDC